MPEPMRPIALVDEGLGNSSYLVDLGDGRALAVDPARDPGPYLAAAGARGLTIAYAAETHLHADFVSGSRELAARGARVLAAAAGGTVFGHRVLHDGDEVDLGGLTLRALATPGHAPEHLSYLVLDGSRPAALFSGGSLLVGAVARTDLIAPGRTEELARSLWRSLHERILTLPGDLPVYPTHGAGSFCAAPAGGERTTTIGAEKAASPLLAAPGEDAFVKLLLGGLGSYPPYFLRLREVNRQGPVLHGPGPWELPALPAGQVRALIGAGATLIDARPIAFFAAGSATSTEYARAAASAGSSMHRMTAVSAIANIASVKSLIANFIRRSRFPVGQSYTEPRLLEHPPPRDIPGYRALFATEQARLARDIGGNMTNMSPR